MSTSFHHVAKLRSLCVTLMLLVIGACNAFAQEPTARQQALRQIFQELIEINTTDSVGDTVRAPEAMAARLKAAGLPAEDVRIISVGLSPSCDYLDQFGGESFRQAELAKPRGVEIETDEGVRLYEGVGREDVPRLVAELVAEGKKIYEARVLTSTLEDTYLEAVGGESS